MAGRDLGSLLAALMPAGLIGVSTALAPPAEAASAAPALREKDDVAARLNRVRAAVATVTIAPDPAGGGDPNLQQAWWGNHGWGRPWWHNGGWGWRNGGGWGWHNGGWGNWHPWGNGGWRNGGWGNWHPWVNL